MNNSKYLRLHRPNLSIDLVKYRIPLTLAVIVLALSCSSYGQGLPGKIRGYKVYKAKVSIKHSVDSSDHSNSTDASVKLDDPVVADVSLQGATIDIGARFTVPTQSGQIDFMTFQGFKINGVVIDIEEYRNPFSFKKGEEKSLPKPVRLTVRLSGLTKAVYKELFTANDELAITGTIFAFGKFKKMGIRFKRVIPITVDLTIRNPLHS